jgi:multidrug resistance protein
MESKNVIEEVDSSTHTSSHSSIHSHEDDSHDIEQSPKLGKIGSNGYPESIASSIHSCYPVPRKLRRGLFGHLTIIAETSTPIYYPRRTKWLITTVVALAAAAAPMGSATIMPALTMVAHDFHVSDTVTNLSVALYMLSMSIFPLWWSSFSETLGRRTVYIVSFMMFVVFAILSAVAKSISMLIVMRMLSGGAAASVQAVGAGTIADIWEVKERGRAMGIFYLGPLCGPLLAPIIGGALAQGYGWRATQWFLVAFGGVMTMSLIAFLPETLVKRKKLPGGNQPLEKDETIAEAADGEINAEAASKKIGMESLSRTTTRQSVKKNAKLSITFLKRCFIDPLKIILLLRFPAVAITVYYAAITFGSLYTLNISIERTFSRSPYNFTTIIVGLLYIPNSIGYFIASIFGGRWLDIIMKREARKAGRIDENGKLIFQPEDRMRENAWLAGFMFPAALIWYGWTAEKGVHWIVPVSLLYSCLFLSHLLSSPPLPEKEKT